MERVHASELIDALEQDPAELAESLRLVARVNRWFGGTPALLRHLRRHLDGAAPPLHRTSRSPYTILDVGTGNGEMASDIARWAAARGTPVELTGLDSHPVVIQVAAHRAGVEGSGPHLVRGDALALPFADHSFDLSVSTLTLHHFTWDDAVRIVREMSRVARRGVIVNDLERHRGSYWSARLLGRTLWRSNRLTRHDGPISVLRSFTSDELLEIGRRAELKSPTVRRHFPFRLVLEGRPAFDGVTGGAARSTTDAWRPGPT